MLAAPGYQYMGSTYGGGGGGAGAGASPYMDYASFAMQMMNLMRANADRRKAMSQAMVAQNQAQSQQQVSQQEMQRRRMRDVLMGGGGF